MLFNDDEIDQVLLQAGLDIILEILFLAYHCRAATPRVTYFAEVTVPTYSLDDFRQHFRVASPTFQVIAN